MENLVNAKDGLEKKAWMKPELEVLSLKSTAYWKFEISDSGFPISVWVDES